MFQCPGESRRPIRWNHPPQGVFPFEGIALNRHSSGTSGKGRKEGSGGRAAGPCPGLGSRTPGRKPKRAHRLPSRKTPLRHVRFAEIIRRPAKFPSSIRTNAATAAKAAAITKAAARRRPKRAGKAEKFLPHAARRNDFPPMSSGAAEIAEKHGMSGSGSGIRLHLANFPDRPKGSRIFLGKHLPAKGSPHSAATRAAAAVCRRQRTARAAGSKGNERHGLRTARAANALHPPQGAAP